MVFKTTLYKALDSADKVIIDGVELEDNFTVERNGDRLLHLADETQLLISDTEIEIDEDGEVADSLIAQFDDEPEEVVVKFFMEKPMTEGDLK
jgi:hypothetical protein